MRPFYVYILKCNDKSYYIGHTDNIEQRISEHMLGKISGDCPAKPLGKARRTRKTLQPNPNLKNIYLYLRF